MVELILDTITTVRQSYRNNSRQEFLRRIPSRLQLQLACVFDSNEWHSCTHKPQQPRDMDASHTLKDAYEAAQDAAALSQVMDDDYEKLPQWPDVPQLERWPSFGGADTAPVSGEPKSDDQSSEYGPPTGMDADPLGGTIDRTSDFRIRGKRYHFTYKGHIPMSVLLDKATSVGRRFGSATNYVYCYSGCWEQGSKDGYKHTHFFCEWAQPIDVRHASTFDVFWVHKPIDLGDLGRSITSEMIGDMDKQYHADPTLGGEWHNAVHPNIKRVLTNEHKARIAQYHQKESQRYDIEVCWQHNMDAGKPQDTSRINEYVEMIHSCKTVYALDTHPVLSREMRKSGARSQILSIWSNRERGPPMGEVLRPWQSAICACITTTPLDSLRADYSIFTGAEEAEAHAGGSVFGGQRSRRGSVDELAGFPRLSVDGGGLSSIWLHCDPSKGRPTPGFLAGGAIPPSSRKLLWIYEPTGGVGKSWFARWLATACNAAFLTSGKKADLAYIWKRHLDNGGNTIAIFDFARTTSDHLPWELIEQLINGFVVSTKYMADTEKSEPVRVICFANYPPPRDDKGNWPLSVDRYVCCLIEN